MKKLFILVITGLLLVSCGQEIQNNNAAFQAVKDTVFFQTSNNSAVVNPNGSVAVRGATATEEVRILVSTLNQSTVILGPDAIPGNSATYTNEFGTIFSTNNFNGSGEVSLEIDEQGSVSGTFNFVALTENETDTVTFSRGFIYRVPIFGELNNNGGPDAVEDVFTARVNTVIYNPTAINGQLVSGLLFLSGNTTDRSMVIRVPDNIVPGTYDITPGGLYAASYTVDDDVSEAVSGSLTIVTHNTTEQRITGSFVFETPDGFLITDGEFAISYN